MLGEFHREVSVHQSLLLGFLSFVFGLVFVVPPWSSSPPLISYVGYMSGASDIDADVDVDVYQAELTSPRSSV